MAIYNFRRLIEKYSVTCKLSNTTDGHWAAGEWVDGKQITEEISGAIVPISEKRINNSGGDYKSGDCELITTSHIAVNSDTFIVYKDKRYKLQDSTDYSDYADFNIYIARRVSAFDGDKADTKEDA